MQFDSAKMVNREDTNHYKATCATVVEYLLGQQEKALADNGFSGMEVVCVKCYENCDGDFRAELELDALLLLAIA